MYFISLVVIMDSNQRPEKDDRPEKLMITQIISKLEDVKNMVGES
jgi:hypothetical protein